MSKISLSSNILGTGTLTIASPNTDTDRTLTLPDNSGTLLSNASTFAGTGPAFSAYASSTTSLVHNTYTKIRFQTEEFDTSDAYDNTTNYRFQPTVAGYYQLTAAMNVQVTGYAIISFFKNGSEFKRGTQLHVSSSINLVPNSSALIYLNGSTDYVEVYGYQNTGVSINVLANQAETYFQGFLARAA